MDGGGQGPKVVVWGLMAHAPFGGMTWQVIHHLLGLRVLGYDVWYVEDSDARMLDLSIEDWSSEPARNAAYVGHHLAAIGMPDRWVVRVPGGRECHGALDWAGLLTLYSEAEVVINVCGAHELRAHHDGIRNLVYVETDPVANAVALASGVEWKRDELARYRCRVTYASNIASADCRIPRTELSWCTSVPPVSVGLWRTRARPSNGSFTTVMNWSSPEGAVVWQGQRWEWSKREPFLRIAHLPELCSTSVEVALRQASEDVQEMLRRLHWRIVDARTLDRPAAYRRYIRSSLAEVSVAKEQYVAPRSGWISDRTVCYLAAGRPAVVERTHVTGVPLGLGLVDFSGVDEAAAAIDEVVAHYPRHARAARELAEEYFAADKVMAKMLSAAGLR